MKILTIDASTHSTGYAIGQNEKLIKHGCICSNKKNVIQRIIIMRNQLSKIIQNENIEKIIMEEVRPEYNSHTNKVLMWLQAIIIITAYEINSKIQYELIGASSWRAALHMKQGRGIKRETLKNQDIKYVEDKYNIKVNDDEADAICIFDSYWTKQNNEINWE